MPQPTGNAPARGMRHYMLTEPRPVLILDQRRTEWGALVVTLVDTRTQGAHPDAGSSAAGDFVIFATACLICLLCTALLAMSFVTIEHIKAIYLTHRALVTVRSLLIQLRWADVVILASSCVCGLGIIVLQLTHRGLDRLIGGRLPTTQVITLAFMLVWYGHAILLPGLIVTGDGGAHVARVSHLAMAIRGGDSLYWDNYFFGGGLLLQNTGPVFHWLAALVTLAVGDPTLGVKIVSFIARFAAGFLMLAYLRVAGLSRAAAFLGAAFFAGSFYISYIVSIRCKFPTELHFTAFMAALACLECLLAQRRASAASWLGFCLACILMIGNHQPTAVMGAVFLALYVGFRLWAQRTLAPLRPLLLAAGTIAAGSCCFVIPFAIERAWSAEPTITGGGVIGLAWPNPADLLNYVIWEKGGAGPVSTAYIGMVVLAIACLGAVMLTQRRVRDMAGAKLWGVFVGFTALSLFLVGPQVRPAVFTFTFLCITAACSVDMLIAIFPRRAWLPTLIFAAFSVDAAIAPLQPYTRSDMLSIEREGAELAQRADGQRVVEVTGGPTPASINVTVGPSSTPLHLARVEMLYGPHKLDATKAHNAMVAALSLAATDLRRDGRLSDATEMLLEQYNVGWLVGFEGGKPGLPVSIGAPLDDAVLGRYVKLSHATPILACMRVEQHERPATFDAPPFWDSSFTGVPMAADASAARVQDLALIAAMGIDLGQRVCNTVLMPVVSQGQAWAIRPSATPKVTLQSYRVGAGRVALRVASDLPAFLRIAHPMFPGVRITRNGVPADAAADVFSLIVLPIEAGETEIAIEVQPSWLRRVCIWVSAGAVIALSTNLLRISIVAARRPQLGSVLNQRDG